MKHVLIATARWTAGTENPSGGDNPSQPVSKTLQVFFEAESASPAMRQADIELRRFKHSLPKEKISGLGFNSQPIIEGIILAQIIDFSPQPDIVPR